MIIVLIIYRWHSDVNHFRPSQVRYLEQQNKLLETKWKLLQGQTAAASDVEPMLKSYISNLQRQLDLLNSDKLRMETEKDAMLQHVDANKRQ